MSRQLKNDAGERKLRVTLLSAEWKASSNGDLTTINRELAIQMAKHPNVEVSVFLPRCSEEDKRDAESYNVKLVEPVKLPGLKPVVWLACVPDGHAIDCVVGHGVALGQQIPLIKNNPNYTHCKWIQVVHNAPEEIGMYKNISEGQQMQQTEIELCKMADQVVTIGPKLTDAYRYQLRNQDVFNLTPSILTEFLDVQQASDDRRTFCVPVIESGDSEDFYVKGYDIAGKAIANLKDKSYQLRFASKQRGKEDELADKLLQCGIGRNQLIICSFDENRETLANLFSVVNIAILPSKTEGFGLSALEALSAGLPVLVSGNSGIAEALREVPNGSQCIVDSEDPADWARAIKAVRNKKRNVRLAEAKILRGNYLQQFSWEEPCDLLVKRMCNLVFGASSSEFHSISSTSESPEKQEELKKWEQKSKIVETEKLKGTSPLTVKPSTGLRKEFTEKEQQRKGMLPLHGSSTSDPEEKLEELRMNLKKEGTSPSNVPFTAGHKKKWEVRHNTGKFQEKKGSSPPPLFSTTDLKEKLRKVCEEIKMLRMEGSFLVLKSTTFELEEKLAELSMELQRLRVEGTLPPPELFTADLEEELERIGLILQKEKGSSPPPVSIIETATRLRQELKKVRMRAPKSSIYNMSTTPDIDKIDNIVDMADIMRTLKISSKGLKTLDEMKSKVKETLQSLAKNSSWTEEAYSVLTEAKKEDERKRAALLNFYERTDVCLQSIDGKVHALLEQNIGNLKEKIASHKQNLKKESIVLVAGEPSSGKSTLLNLILGEQLLPYSTLFSASTICELRYGDTPKLVAHFKGKGSGDTTETVLLDKPSEASEQTYLRQISEFTHLKTSREKSSDYEKIELFWPHNLLKENIVIVDSPGIGESTIMDDIVEEYLLEAFAFICVINRKDAGGTHQDRVEKFIKHARQVSLDKQRESSSNCALFVCNKWDQVPPQTDEVKNHIVTKLTQCWPSLDPESQIIYMSARDASEAQKLGVVTEEFAELMNGIKSMVLKGIEARLQIQWRWLDYLLERMAFHAKAFIHYLPEDRKSLIERLKFTNDRLKTIEGQQSKISEELHSYLEDRTKRAVSSLSTYLQSPEVMQQFSSWTLDDVPNTQEGWDLTWNFIQKALTKRLQEKMEEWEVKNHFFSDTRAYLIQLLQERFGYGNEQLRSLEGLGLTRQAARRVPGKAGAMSTAKDASSARAPLVNKSFFDEMFGPLGQVFSLLVKMFKEKWKNWYMSRQYNEDNCAFMVEASQKYLNEAAQEQHVKSYVMEKLKDVQVFLKQALHRIPKLIEEDKMLCRHLKHQIRCKGEENNSYELLHEKSVQIRGEMTRFGIKEVRTMDISCDDLEWQDDALLESGAFAAVYRGKLKIRGEDKPVDVAVKVWNEELDEVTTCGFLSETEILRKLNHPFIVKFYGAALQEEGERLKAILVMELCKENLLRHIFWHESNKPGKSSTATAARDMIRWAKDIADALEYIHRQGIVHRDLKLENILLSPENIAKVANVGVSKEAKAIKGTRTETLIYLAPEVIKSPLYDYKANIYCLGIMLWEMWYGKRPNFDVDKNLPECFEKGVEGVRPTHVQGLKKPPAGLNDLMQHCWDGKPDNRPDARECYEKLTQLYQEVSAPSS